MPQVSYTVTEPYSKEQMFDLVNNIDDYRLFVPDCINSGVVGRDEKQMIAFLEVEKLGFKKRFITKNTLIAHSQIIMELIDGPFSQLKGSWNFIEVDANSCTIELNLQFEFKNKLMEIAFTPIFKDIMTNMVKAFSHRAKQVYKSPC